ncbi:hypothetical protein P7C71_g3659, partial [Lecanoromycetidae sp. Uapishka_2]
MPIAALSPGTVSAIGSTQGLSDSASLVKELIDNAIDAGATVISVEVSVNTLDDIRVKDNGHGVAPEDRSMMCTRHCTSKIRDLKDLHNIGGHSLGFRGEALASAAELSGSLTISTRIEGEPTAAEIAFSRHGQISRYGTIVRVEKFLETLPVRQQTAMKTSIKTLAKMRRTLQAYVLARPHLCLSLKILKAKSDKDNWKFPKTGQLGSSKVTATPINAAIDILGKKVIDQCDWKISTLSSAEGETGAYTFEAVLAKNDCDGAIISNVGQFISVDSRPVSLKRTFKQIVSRYKSAVRSKGASDDRSKVVDPLLFMNIVCPTGSYDVNVEPAKDDVLFANPDLVLRLVDMFFRTIYGDPQPDMPKVRLSSTPMIHGTELMLARKRTPVKDTSPPPRLPATSKPPARSHDLNLREGRHLNTGLDAEPTSPIVTASSTNLDRTETPSESTPATNPSSPTMPVTSREVLRQPLLLSRPSTKPTWTPSMYAEDEDDMEELERVLNASVQPPLDVHPDLAITMDYEARKQQAELQHRESLRRMAAAKKRDTELATDEARNAAGAPPNARNSPYKNRQSKAKAALHDGDETGGQDTQNENTFEENDPRAYLLRVQEREAAAQNAGPNAPRVKRRKTTMLPFESMHEDNHTCGLTLTSKVISSDLEKRVERSALHDQYIREGEEVEGLSSPSTQQIGYWGLVLKALVKASYRIEGMRPEEEMDGNLDVDLDDTLRLQKGSNDN